MKRKAYIAETDVAVLLKRYDSSTILSVLYEISKSSSNEKLNWEALARDTNTGIKSPREYQALWRHLAYRKELDPVEADDLPLEDDGSDLEFELEPFPTASAEATNEASNYVKTLVGFPADVSANPETVERKKRKLWSAQEDEELRAGIEKYGEGNWSSILKNVFRHDRTASQLAQRWGIIKKKRETGIAPTPTTPPDHNEHAKKAEISRVDSAKPANTRPDIKQAFQQPSVPRATSLNPVMPTPKSVNSKAMSTCQVSQSRPSGPDPMVQAAAVAAGARIAPASAAASLLKAAQTKNMVHIRPGTNPTSSSSTTTKPCINNSNNNVGNVHYIRTGSGAPPPMLSSLNKRKQGTSTAGTTGFIKNCTVSKMVTVVNNKSGNVVGSSSNPRLAIRNSKDGSIQEITETKSLKKKVIVARESNGLVRVNSWYEGEELPADGKSVVEVDSEDNEDIVALGTPPLSQSSGQSE